LTNGFGNEAVTLTDESAVVQAHRSLETVKFLPFTTTGPEAGERP
jgi:hypothetical protein